MVKLFDIIIWYSGFFLFIYHITRTEGLELTVQMNDHKVRKTISGIFSGIIFLPSILILYSYNMDIAISDCFIYFILLLLLYYWISNYFVYRDFIKYESSGLDDNIRYISRIFRKDNNYDDEKEFRISTWNIIIAEIEYVNKSIGFPCKIALNRKYKYVYEDYLRFKSIINRLDTFPSNLVMNDKLAFAGYTWEETLRMTSTEEGLRELARIIEYHPTSLRAELNQVNESYQL